MPKAPCVQDRRQSTNLNSVSQPDMPRYVRRALRWCLILFSALGLVAFAITSLAVTSSPVPRDFDGWAAVFVRDVRSTSRLYFSVKPLTPGGYGAHPAVEYSVAFCGARSVDGLLVLAGDARLNVAADGLRGVSTTDERSVALVPSIVRLSIEDTGTGASTDARAVQVLRIALPAAPCRFKYEPDVDAPAFYGSAAALRGPLEGRLVHQSFAPFGLWPARQAQSWPLLGRAPRFSANSLGEFALSSGLGRWSRPFQSYFDVGVGSLDARALVEFARPQPADSEALSWTSSTPIAPKARVVNSDNLSRWQVMALVAGIWLGIGGSVLASMAFEAVRASSSSSDRPDDEASLPPNSPQPAGARGSLLFGAILLVFLVRGRSR